LQETEESHAVTERSMVKNWNSGEILEKEMVSFQN